MRHAFFYGVTKKKKKWRARIVVLQADVAHRANGREKCLELLKKREIGARSREARDVDAGNRGGCKSSGSSGGSGGGHRSRKCDLSFVSKKINQGDKYIAFIDNFLSTQCKF